MRLRLGARQSDDVYPQAQQQQQRHPDVQERQQAEESVGHRLGIEEVAHDLDGHAGQHRHPLEHGDAHVQRPLVPDHPVTDDARDHGQPQ
jgi:hypothetical protein